MRGCTGGVGAMKDSQRETKRKLDWSNEVKCNPVCIGKYMYSVSLLFNLAKMDLTSYNLHHLTVVVLVVVHFVRLITTHRYFRYLGKKIHFKYTWAPQTLSLSLPYTEAHRSIATWPWVEEVVFHFCFPHFQSPKLRAFRETFQYMLDCEHAILGAGFCRLLGRRDTGRVRRRRTQK